MLGFCLFLKIVMVAEVKGQLQTISKHSKMLDKCLTGGPEWFVKCTREGSEQQQMTEVFW